MKNKILYLILFFLPVIFLVSPKTSYANIWGILPPTEIAGGDEVLYGKYPCVGANEPSAFFLDTTSAYAHTDGNVAKLSCIVLSTGGGVGPDGGPGIVSPSTYVFKTYKKKKKRVIILESLTDSTGTVRFSNVDASKDKYLYALFWRVAGITGMNHFLD